MALVVPTLYVSISTIQNYLPPEGVTFLLAGFLLATSFFFFSGAEDLIGALPVPVGLVFLVTLAGIILHQYNHVLKRRSAHAQ